MFSDESDLPYLANFKSKICVYSVGCFIQKNHDRLRSVHNLALNSNSRVIYYDGLYYTVYQFLWDKISRQISENTEASPPQYME